MPKTAEPRYTETEYDEMYGPRLDKIEAGLNRIIDRLTVMVEKQKAKAEKGQA